jgi:hypothetical protein
MDRIPAELIPILVTAAGEGEIPFIGHIAMQEAFQKYTDSSISKTINMPSSTTKEEMFHAYIDAWNRGLKGITMYRDQSRGYQVLARKETGEEGTRQEYRRPLAQKAHVLELPIGEMVEDNGVGGKPSLITYDPARVFITVGYDPLYGKINSVFLEKSTMDDQMSHVINQYCIEISHALRAGDTREEMERLIKQWESHKTRGAMGILSEDGTLRTQVANDTIPNALLKTMYFMRFVTNDFTDLGERGMLDRYMLYRTGKITLREIVDPYVKGRITVQEENGNPSILPKGMVPRLPEGLPEVLCPSC